MFRAFEVFILAAMLYVPCFGETATTASPLTGLVADNSICFSPDEGCDDRLARLYSLAEKTIDVAIYDINRPVLVLALIAKAKTLKVRVIVDERQSRGPHSQVPQLVKSGVQVRFGHQRGIMHDKFSIVDGIALETGSYNYTTHASEANQENQLYTVDPKILARYCDRYNAMWEKAKPFHERKVK